MGGYVYAYVTDRARWSGLWPRTHKLEERRHLVEHEAAHIACAHIFPFYLSASAMYYVHVHCIIMCSDIITGLHAVTTPVQKVQETPRSSSPLKPLRSTVCLSFGRALFTRRPRQRRQARHCHLGLHHNRRLLRKHVRRETRTGNKKRHFFFFFFLARRSSDGVAFPPPPPSKAFPCLRSTSSSALFLPPSLSLSSIAPLSPSWLPLGWPGCSSSKKRTLTTSFPFLLV